MAVAVVWSVCVVFVCECLRDFSQLVFEGDVCSGRRGSSDHLAAVIFDFRKLLWHGEGAGPETIGGNTHVEPLMRALVIVDHAPVIEGALYFREGPEAVHGKHLRVHGAVEAFVLAASLKMTRSGMDDANAELEQPYLHPGPVHAGRIAPGRTKNKKEDHQQAIALE